MAVKKRRKTAYPAYVSGSTAPKLEPVRKPEPRKKRKPEHRSEAHAVTVRRNRERALQMDFPYVFMLTVASVCALYICSRYLQLQSDISARVKHIDTLERQIEELKADNDALQTSINTSVDLDHVYKVATEELGMVYANKDQVRLFDKTESEYVRQYEDIPEQ